MNRFRKRLVVFLAAGAVVALPTTVVFLQGSGSGQASPAPRFTPVELANGLAFNQGAAATRLVVFGRPDVAVAGKLLAVKRSVDAALRADPSLAGRFAADAQSGNAAKVAAALGVLARLTRAAFRHEFGRASGPAMTAWAREMPENVSIPVAQADGGGDICPQCPTNNPTDGGGSVALSLPYVMTGLHLAGSAERDYTAETITVVAFSLNAD